MTGKLGQAVKNRDILWRERQNTKIRSESRVSPVIAKSRSGLASTSQNTKFNLVWKMCAGCGAINFCWSRLGWIYTSNIRQFLAYRGCWIFWYQIFLLHISDPSSKSIWTHTNDNWLLIICISWIFSDLIFIVWVSFIIPQTAYIWTNCLRVKTKQNAKIPTC